MIDTRAVDRQYSWFRLAITLVIATVGNAGMRVITVVMPLVQAEFGIDRADASLPYMMTMIGLAFGNLVIGRAVDRIGLCACCLLWLNPGTFGNPAGDRFWYGDEFWAIDC